MKPIERKPHGLDGYRHTHDAYMQSLRSTCLVGTRRFIGRDTLAFVPGQVEGTIWLRGQIACLGDIVITVAKMLRIVDAKKNRVLAERYNYNVHLSDGALILRYDNAHSHPGHRDAYHKHVYDPFVGDVTGRVEWIGHDYWPTLADVIKEVYRWYGVNASQLESPRTYPPLETRG
jgi:hypothetical protein